MKVLFYILNDAALLNSLLNKLNSVGINGCTILDSNGMGRELAKTNDDFNIMFGSLRKLLKPQLSTTKTMMLVLDEEKIPAVVQAIESVVGSLDEIGSGLLFTLPLDFVKGLKL